MTELTIFKGNNVAPRGARELSDLAKSLASGGATTRRIQTNVNGTFKRIINGEQIGNAVRGEINVIILHTLPKVSRTFYAGKFDPNAKPTLPDCWSNLGDTPEAGASNKQAPSCVLCPQNVKGSGENGGKTCRYQRRISVLVCGDDTGDIYQFNVPAKSLFGKGVGNVHPFESYIKYLLANGESPDGVVTNISYDLNADTMELLFTPLRNTSDDEYELVLEAQKKPEAKSYTVLTVAQGDKVTAIPAPVTKPIVSRSDEPEDDAPAEPVKRAKKAEAPATTKADMASVIDQWGSE
jgi:hypothetical protein